MSKPSITLAQAWKVFSQKGPVHRAGANTQYAKAARIMSEFLTPQERQALGIARSHAETGEGRGEWDGVCKRVAERLRRSGAPIDS